MTLSDLSLRKAKGREKPYRISDERGLYAIIQPSGAVWWRFDYIVNGKRKTMSMGVYPDVPLADAREARDEARKLVAKGVDPVAAKRAAEKAKVENTGNTFRVIAQEHIDDLREKGRTLKTIEKNEWYLFDLASEICDDPVTEIPASKVLKVIRHIEASGRVDTAHRVRAAIGSVFRLAIRTDRATVDPTLALRGTLLPIKATPQSAIVDETSFGRLLQCVDEYDGWPTLRAALQIMALCYPRPVELRKAEWGYIDLKGKRWTIPAHLTKMRREHIIPLSRQAVSILEGVRKFSGEGRLVFPSIRNMKRPLSENAMNSALRRMGYASDEHTSHGFRSSASSILNERGFRYDVIEASLAHLDPNEVRRTYNRTAYLKERTEMAQAWADICDELKKRKRRDHGDLI